MASGSATRHLYVHVPFCTRRCSYCDFAISVRPDVPVAAFVGSLLAEAELRHNGDIVQQLDTIYFGGGTPSKLGPDGVAGLIAGLGELGMGAAQGAEVTIEANPEDVNLAAVRRWLTAGVNRLSIGIQSFSPAALSWMHRSHGAADAEAAVRVARAAGVGNISIDLIYALPDSVSRRWADDLERAIALEPDHLSVYGLTIEPQTPLGRWAARGEVAPQTDDRAADEFLAAHAALTAAGFEHYEVSNYGRPGRRSRHNSAYWRRVPYLGLGPSAHSFDGAARRWNVAAYVAWDASVQRGHDPCAGAERLSSAQGAAEAIYLGLRTDSGVPLSSVASAAGVQRWVDAGWAIIEDGHLRLTADGWLRLDALAGSLEPVFR